MEKKCEKLSGTNRESQLTTGKRMGKSYKCKKMNVTKHLKTEVDFSQNIQIRTNPEDTWILAL